MIAENIRNFVIISHIDHGKSTLADRFLEITNTVEARNMHDQMLDSMDLERERGITIKMAPVQMDYRFEEKDYELNLIDTPGHVDFSYEVSRALAAVEGAILLVDGTKGVQAQTLAHLEEAQKQGLVVIPAINKIDLPIVRPGDIEEEIKRILPSAEKIFRISAKKGQGVEDLLGEVIKKVPPPEAKNSEGKTRALIFDSHYDTYKGVLAYVRVVEGAFKGGDEILFISKNRKASILEVGSFKPQLKSKRSVNEGSIGYIATGLKEPEVVMVGDTIALKRPEDVSGAKIEALGGYKEPKPVVFASVFPTEGIDFKLFKDAFFKLKLSDWALVFEPTSSEVLGQGFRCGFLGSLHLEIILERLQREFNIPFVATTPSVSYQLNLVSGETVNIYNPSDFPDVNQIKEISEPWVKISIFTPERFIGGIMKLVQSRRGISAHTEYLSPERIELSYDIPLAEVISDFYDKLKSVSSGFASLFYEPTGYRVGDLVKLKILVAGDEVEAFSKIVPRVKAYEEGRAIVKKLKELLPRQLFAVSLQAALGGKIIAREDLSALKKDVTGHLYGGDITRKMKLREKQKRGKKKLKKIGRVSIPDRVFVEMLKTSSKD